MYNFFLSFFSPGNASPSTFILVLCISYLDLKVFDNIIMLSFSSLLLNPSQLPTSAQQNHYALFG